MSRRRDTGNGNGNGNGNGDSDAAAARPPARAYYSMPEKREEHVPFGASDGYAGPLPGGCTGDTLRTRANVGAAIQRLSHDVYARIESAPRETLANEMTQAAIAAGEHGARPSIEVTIDPAARLFAVQGMDTMGMEWDAFVGALAVIGATTNADPRRAGQMGMGFYANTLLSDTILLESHSRTSGERFTAMCKGGTEWQVGLRSAPMPLYGVRVSMTVRKGIDLDRLSSAVAYSSLLSPCPVVLVKNGRRRDLPRYADAKSLVRALYYYDIQYGRRSYEYDCEAMHRIIGEQGIDGVSYLHGERDGIEACAAVCTRWDFQKSANGSIVSRSKSKMRPSTTQWHATSGTFLIGMPIDLNYFGRGRFRSMISALAVNVHDERAYPPTADRERFDSDTEARIRGKIDLILEDALRGARHPATLAGHLRSPIRGLTEVAARGTLPEVVGSLMPAAGTAVREACAAGRLPVREAFAKGVMPLSVAYEMFPRLVVTGKADAARILAVARHDPRMRVIVSRDAGIAQSAEIERIEDYMERRGIAPLANAEIAEYLGGDEWLDIRRSFGAVWPQKYDEEKLMPEPFATYAAAPRAFGDGGHARIERGSAGALDARTVLAERRLSALVGSMRATHGGGWKVAKARGGRKGGAHPHPGASVPEAKFLAWAASATYETSSGKMTGAEIAAHGGRIAVIQYDGPCRRLAAAIRSRPDAGKRGTLYVVCEGKEHFGILALFGAGNAASPAAPAAPADPAAGARGAGAGRCLRRRRDLFRVVARARKLDDPPPAAMPPPGAETMIYDEFPAMGGIKGRIARGMRMCGGELEWSAMTDCLLAALELKSETLLAAFADGAGVMVEDSADGGGGGGRRMRPYRLLDELSAIDASSGTKIRRLHRTVRHPPHNLINYDLGFAPDTWRFADSTAWGRRGIEGDSGWEEAGMAGLGSTYHTNNGVLSGRRVVAMAKHGKNAGATDILVYGRAAGLAAVLFPSSSYTCAVVRTCDAAFELACALAASGAKSRIGIHGRPNMRSIMEAAVPDAVKGGLPGYAGETESSEWLSCAATWHGLLAIQNGAMRSLFSAMSKSYVSQWHVDEIAYGRILDRALWLDASPDRAANGDGLAAAAATAATDSAHASPSGGASGDRTTATATATAATAAVAAATAAAATAAAARSPNTYTAAPLAGASQRR